MKRFVLLLWTVWLCFLPAGCKEKTQTEAIFGLQPERSMKLSYATGFAVDYYPGGYQLIAFSDGRRFLTVPENQTPPDGLAEDVTLLQQPLDNIYMAAASVMSFTDALGRLDAVGFSGMKAEDWHIAGAKAAMEEEKILYAGNYRTPDYELLLSGGCRLALESTMINYAPEVKEKLLELGIPIWVDLSSKEPHPLGRTEWLKLYGALFNEEELAEQLFTEQENYLNSLSEQPFTGKTVSFFYVTSDGTVTVRKPDDYIVKMIELAGGEYIFSSAENAALISDSTTIEPEAFYAAAWDADVLLYNSTNTGEIYSLEELVALDPLLRDFTAVQTGTAWCIGENLFQEAIQHGKVILELNRLLTDDTVGDNGLEFFFRLQ